MYIYVIIICVYILLLWNEAPKTVIRMVFWPNSAMAVYMDPVG